MINFGFKLLSKEDFLKKLAEIKKKLEKIKDEKTPPSDKSEGGI